VSCFGVERLACELRPGFYALREVVSSLVQLEDLEVVSSGKILTTPSACVMMDAPSLPAFFSVASCRTCLCTSLNQIIFPGTLSNGS
jgi:hypothetical protein